MDLSYHTTPARETNGCSLHMVLHFIDEASTYHTAKLLTQARCSNYSDLVTCATNELIAAIAEWAGTWLTLMCSR